MAHDTHHLMAKHQTQRICASEPDAVAQTWCFSPKRALVAVTDRSANGSALACRLPCRAQPRACSGGPMSSPGPRLRCGGGRATANRPATLPGFSSAYPDNVLQLQSKRA